LASVLGRAEESDAHFAQALVIHERLQAPFHVSLTKACWALALAGRDDERARVLAGEALDVAQAGGYGEVERKALRVLRPDG
jgi:hypothetical protein